MVSGRKVDLCLAIEDVSSILTIIFQYSLDIGKLPMEWKRANVVPIFKSGSSKKDVSCQLSSSVPYLYLLQNARAYCFA